MRDLDWIEIDEGIAGISTQDTGCSKFVYHKSSYDIPPNQQVPAQMQLLLIPILSRVHHPQQPLHSARQARDHLDHSQEVS